MTQTPEQIAAVAKEMQQTADAQRYFTKCQRLPPSVVVGPFGHCPGRESTVVAANHGHAIRTILENRND